MGNIGHKIIANSDYSSLTKPIYPFFKPSVSARQYDPPSYYFAYPYPPPHPFLPPPVYNNSYMHSTRHSVYNSLIKEKIQDLEDALKERQTIRKEQTLAKVQSLAQLSTINEEKDQTSAEMLRIMSRQQELFGDMVRSVQNLLSKFNFPPSSLEYGYPAPRPAIEKPREKSAEKSSEKSSEKVISKENILKDLDLASDDDSDYLDKSGKYHFEKLTEEEKVKLYEKLDADKIAKEKEYYKKKIKGIHRFRAVIWAIMFPVFIFGIMIKRKGTMKGLYVKDMKESIEIFLEVAGSWVLKAVREPIMSILSDTSLNFKLSGKDLWFSKGKPDALNTKILKIHVRVRGIFQGLIAHTNKQSLPKPLMIFIDKYINNGAFIPINYLVPYEKSRLEFDKFGALCNQNEEKKGMMIAFFFLSRILVEGFLLNPQKHGLPIQKNSNVLG